MLVKCISKFAKDLPVDCLIPDSGYDKSCIFHLKPEKYYIVYAMRIFSGYLWYYLCDENYQYYPFHNPSPLFKIVNGSLSKYWVYSFTMDKNCENARTIFSFPEWVYGDNYYDLLTDGKEKEVKIFREYKNLMDLEFPDPYISNYAQLLDNEWLLCPLCIDAWQSISTDGMVICPKCNNLLLNPRYKETPKTLESWLNQSSLQL